jgi:hypothetical protein
MKILTAAAITLAFMQPALAQQVEISRAGTRAATQGLAEYFTGTVQVGPLFEAKAPGRTSGANVTFSPGARSAWQVSDAQYGTTTAPAKHRTRSLQAEALRGNQNR